MDWKKTFSRGQWYFHAVFFLAVSLIFGTLIFALRLNQLQKTEDQRSIKLNNLVQEIKNDKTFDLMAKDLSRTDSDKANDKMRILSKKIAVIEELLEIKASTKVRNSIKKFNSLITKNSALSDPSEALRVLKNKMIELNEFAKDKKYPTVIIVSGRMLTNIKKLSSNNVGKSRQVERLGKDLTTLNRVVMNSTLDDGEKNALLAKFNSMKSELELLQGLKKQVRLINSESTASNLALMEWVIELEKVANNFQKIKLEKSKKLIIALSIIIAFVLFAWIGAAYILRWEKIKMSEQVEDEVKNVIEKGIMSDQRFMMDHYSESTRDKVIRLLDELKTKLNLGTMLHNGLPLAGCMFDKNFKLTWFNNLFLDQFYFSEEEVRSDSFSWDFLKNYLNLKDDPVYEAIVNKISGIFPIKLKQDELTPSRPFEMYVTPINVNREDRVMVFFYPLIAVNDAILEQVHLTKKTLNSFMDHWVNDSFDDDLLKDYEKEFKVHDMEDLYFDLLNFKKSYADKRKEQDERVKVLEEENSRYLSSIEEMQKIDENKKQILKEKYFIISQLREKYLSTLERFDEILFTNKMILNQTQQLDDYNKKSEHLNNDLNSRVSETKVILEQMEGPRGDTKKLKTDLVEIKSKLISLNNFLFSQLPPFDDHQQKLANRYKDELARLEVHVASLDKKLSQLDIFLSKLQIIYQKTTSALEPLEINYNKKTIQKGLDEKALQQEKDEEIIVEKFKRIHELMKNDLSHMNLKQKVSHQVERQENFH